MTHHSSVRLCLDDLDGMAQAVRRQEYHPLQTSGPMVTGPYVGLYGRDGNPSPEHISKDST
jgi:hypothetical protein